MHLTESRLTSCFILLLSPLATACTTDEDCSLNGICSEDATCLCDPGWRTADCGELDLRPATRGTGYNHTAANASADPLGGGTAGNSSWGGQILRDRHDARKFHLITSQFAHGCGLSAWKPFSTVIRAESTTGPRGPYVWAQELLAPFTHNPTAVWSPADAAYLLYHIGRPDYAPLPDACGHHSIAPNNISVLTSPDLRQWTPSAQVLTNATNPAPWPLPAASGRVVALAVEDNVIYVSANSTHAAAYTRVVAPADQPWTEDPFLWRDARGHWHLLVHYMIDVEQRGEKGPNVGAHLFARELAGPWTFNARTLAYNTTVQWDDGSAATQLYRRERPKLFFDPDREDGAVPLFLVNGVQERKGIKESWTLVQPVGERAGEWEREWGF